VALFLFLIFIFGLNEARTFRHPGNAEVWLACSHSWLAKGGIVANSGMRRRRWPSQQYQPREQGTVAVRPAVGVAQGTAVAAVSRSNGRNRKNPGANSRI
jgi:hypothetical protein